MVVHNTKVKEVIHLGLMHEPYPTVKAEYDPEAGDIKNRFKIIQDDDHPLEIHSYWPDHYRQQGFSATDATEAAREKVKGLAYRNMPIPSMLEYFTSSTEARKPEGRNNRLELVFGPPGVGKSYGAKLHSALRDPQPPLFFDCAGRDLGDLLFELVLDRGSNPDLYSKIERRIAEHNSGEHPLKKPSIVHLEKEELKSVFSDNNGIISIEWDKFGQLSPSSSAQPLSQETLLRRAKQLLLDFVRDEGIAITGSSDIQFKEQKGKLIQAYEQNRALVLDELNLAKPGGLDKIKVLLQMLSGEPDDLGFHADEYTAYAKSGESYTISRSGFGDNFFVSANGNFVGDGISTQSLPGSVYDRFKQYPLSKMTKEDFQHRFCQALTGAPVSTLYTMDKDRWEKNPAEFARFLQKTRKMGLNKQEQAAQIKPYQLDYLDHWAEVVEASGRIAQFYMQWQQLTDPQHVKESNLSQILLEIDADYSARVGAGPRMMMRHILESLNPGFRAVDQQQGLGFDSANFGKGSKKTLSMKEEPSERAGSRFVEILTQEIQRTTAAIPKPELRKMLIKAAVDAGLFPPSLKEARASTRKTIPSLLDVDPFKGKSLTRQALIVRDILCDELRREDANLSEDNDKLIKTESVEKAMREVMDTKGDIINEFARHVHVRNAKPDEVLQRPYRRVVAHDSGFVPSHDTTLELEPEQLESYRDLLHTLAIPALHTKTLDGCFNTALANRGSKSMQYSGIEEADEALHIAMRDKAKSSLATTSLAVSKVNNKGKLEQAIIHIVKDDKAGGRTLIVGDTIDDATRQLMGRVDISFIDRNNPDAAERFDHELAVMLKGKPANAAEALKQAFLYRNTIKKRYQGAELTLGDLCTREVTICEMPVYVTQFEEMNHVDKILKDQARTAGKGV